MTNLRGKGSVEVQDIDAAMRTIRSAASALAANGEGESAKAKLIDVMVELVGTHERLAAATDLCAGDQRLIVFVDPRPCADNCRLSIKPECNCSCLGINHGLGVMVN